MFLQYVAAGIVSGIASLSIGTVLGFSAILIPQLIDEGIIDSDKSTDASWIGKYSTDLLYNFFQYFFLSPEISC